MPLGFVRIELDPVLSGVINTTQHQPAGRNKGGARRDRARQGGAGRGVAGRGGAGRGGAGQGRASAAALSLAPASAQRAQHSTATCKVLVIANCCRKSELSAICISGCPCCAAALPVLDLADPWLLAAPSEWSERAPGPGLHPRVPGPPLFPPALTPCSRQ